MGQRHAAAVWRTIGLGLSITLAMQLATVRHAPAGAAPNLADATYGKLPLLFEPNHGQARRDSAFVARGPGYDLHLVPGGMVAALRKQSDTPGAAGVRVRFIDADMAAPITGGRQRASTTNYLIGDDPLRWRTDIANFERVTYRDLYPGIDLVFYGNQRRLEYDFVIAPGASPAQIALAFDAIDPGERPPTLQIDETGRLVLLLDDGRLAFEAPVAYQIIDGARHHVPARYRIDGQTAGTMRVAFEVGAHDAGHTLVIDPVLVYSGYLGGSRHELAGGIAVDAAGNAYITGETRSNDFDLEKALQPFNGYPDLGVSGIATAFVAKLNPAGDALVYSTYYGGSTRAAGCFNGADSPRAIAVDGSGNAYIAGYTCSVDLPGAQNSINADGDAFVAKLNAAGNAVVYARYLGGSKLDHAAAIAVDPAGNAYVGGGTVRPGIFPTTPGTWRPQRDTSNPSAVDGDGFVTKLSPSGAIIWSTYIGPSGYDGHESVSGIAIDQQNPPNVFVAGSTGSATFPTTAGAYDRELGESIDAFVVKLNPSGSAPIYSTFYGGSGPGGEDNVKIALGPQGNAYITGSTNVTNLPLTTTPFDATPGGGHDAFLAVFNAAGSALQYSTYLGAEDTEIPRGIAVRGDGVAYIAGSTRSTGFPVRDAIQSADGVGCTGGRCPGGTAVFVSWIRPEGRGHQDLVFSTYLGGNGEDIPAGIAVDGAGSAYVVGTTLSTDFPQAGFPVQDKNDGVYDVFVTKIGTGIAPPTDTPTRVSTSTRTPAVTPTHTHSPTRTATRTATATASVTATGTRTPTASATRTPTRSRTPTATASATPTRTATATPTATPTPDLCGNGRIDDGEECDDGELNSDTEPNRCRVLCVLPTCGDNVLDDAPPFNESCDDGNQLDGDGCPRNCKLQITLRPYLILGNALCDNQPVPIAVFDTATGRDISADPDIEYRYVRGTIAPALLDRALKKFVEKVVEKKEGQELPVVKIARIEVAKRGRAAEVRFAPEQEGLGINAIYAVRMAGGTEVAASNISLVISGMKLAEQTGLEIEPVSPLSSAAGFMTAAIGQEIEEPPLILFKHGPLCNGEADFLGSEGTVRVKSIKFDFFGGIIEGVNLITAIQTVIGSIPFADGPLGFIAKAVEIGTPYIASQFLDFEVSSVAAQNAEEETGETQTEDNVIRVSDRLSPIFPFFNGIVTAKNPGLSAVQATLNLERLCLGKADDSVLVLVGPRLDKVEIRNEPGYFESPLIVPIDGDRTPHAVAMFTMVPSGSPQVLAFDPVHLTGDRVTNFRKKVERFIPGLQQILDDVNVPIEIVVPRGALREGDRQTYRGGNAYFQIKFQYNPFQGTVTVDELRLQTKLPNIPYLTTWTATAPLLPVEPVVRIGENDAVTDGLRRGVGQIRVNACLPFLTGPGSDPVDFEEVRVSGDDIIVYGTKYEDKDGSGRLNGDEPGLPGWTLHLVDLYNRILATTTTGASGEFIMIVPKERFPSETTLFGVREDLQPGWSATNPRYGYRTGLSLAAGGAFLTFGNFRDIELSGMKFHDRDGNGLPGPDEEGLANWQIELVDSFGRVQRTRTDPDGRYELSVPSDAFGGPLPVSVREVPQSGWSATFPEGGAAVPIGALGRPLMSGALITVNFGNFRDLRVFGRKFDDRNGNGRQDSGEPGLPAWTIEFVDTFGRVRRTVTDSDGDYAFRLPLGIFKGPGQASVREVHQPGWVQTFPFNGQARDFPNAADGGLLSDGRYEVNFGNRRVATPTATPTPDGDPTRTSTATATPDGEATDTATPTATMEHTDTPTETPTATRTPANILTGVKYEDVNGNGRRDVDEPRLPGWAIFLDDNLDDVLNNAVSGDGVCDDHAQEECKVTDAGGVYAFLVGEGFYRLREVQQPGWVQTSQNPPDIVVEGGDEIVPRAARPNVLIVPRAHSFQFLDFGNFRLGTVPGMAFEDTDGNGRRDSTERPLAAWTIYADDNDNGRLDEDEARVETGKDGTYLFAGLAPRRHILRQVNRCGYRQVLPAGGAYELDLASGEPVSERNFGARPPAALPGDGNRDGTVSAADLTATVQGLTGARQHSLMDANEDGVINRADLAASASNVFACSGLFALVPPLPTPTGNVANTPTAPPSQTVPRATPTPAPTAPPATVAPSRTPTPGATVTATAAPTTRTPTQTPARSTPTPSPTATWPAAFNACYFGDGSEIPDGDPAGTTAEFVIDDDIQIADLDIVIDIQHSWVGDIAVRLTHVQSGKSAVLIDQPGVPASAFGCGKPDIAALLDDEADTPVETQCANGPAIAGSVRPHNPLSVFDGDRIAGTWRLTIADHASGDTGRLNFWCLSVNGGWFVEGAVSRVKTAGLTAGALASSTDWETLLTPRRDARRARSQNRNL